MDKILGKEYRASSFTGTFTEFKLLKVKENDDSSNNK